MSIEADKAEARRHPGGRSTLTFRNDEIVHRAAPPDRLGALGRIGGASA